MNENIIRSIVRSILSEAQIGKKIQSHIDNLLDNSRLDILGEFPYNENFIMSQVKKELDLKLKRLAQSNFNYTDFYIVRLGDFIVKDNGKRISLAFKNPNFDKNISVPYVFIYQDKMLVLKFGSRFFDTDEEILKSANQLISDFNIILKTQEESGKIIIINDFDTDNTIDLTDYSKISRPEPAKKEVAPLKQKADYRAGSTYKHSKFGKGVVKTSKKFGTDEEGNIVYDVLIDFPEFGQKKLRLKSTKTITA